MQVCSGAVLLTHHGHRGEFVSSKRRKLAWLIMALSGVDRLGPDLVHMSLIADIFDWLPKHK